MSEPTRFFSSTDISHPKPPQSKFKTAVANAVVMPVDNVVINSMTEVITRRVSRKLLATAVEIDFSVRVADKAAASALVSSGSLHKDKLDAELVNQV